MKKQYTVTEKIEYFRDEITIATAKAIALKRRIDRLNEIYAKLLAQKESEAKKEA